ncbi:MAG: archease [Oligoflexia bacterium]|nr:archease [Oligoflexia bacterium]
MPFRYLDDITHADVAFEATGASQEDLFLSASDALLRVMIEELDTIRPIQTREFSISSDEASEPARSEDLLYEYLQKLVYLKDAEALLFRPSTLRFTPAGLHVQGIGESIDRARHELGTDVKGVTLHRFKVERLEKAWRATVVLDI